MNLRSRYVLVPAFIAVVFVLVLTGLVACAVPSSTAVPVPTVHSTPTPTVQPSRDAAPAPAPPGSPYMGFNTWYEFGANISESAILAEADYMVADHLVADGYNLMVLDNGWQQNARTASGQLAWDTSKFPHGIPWLAGQLRAEGIRLGIYTAIGAKTCGPAPGSYGHYALDAATFRSWGVAFVKVDDCAALPAGTTLAQKNALFASFGASVRADGMIYSDEAPVLDAPGSSTWLTAVQSSAASANMWRVAPDEHWNQTALFTISSHLADDTHLHGFARPGHWNDLDMLVPGTVDAHPFNWNLNAAQAQLGVWAMEASPLFLSTDLAKLNAATLASVANRTMIGIDQSGQQSGRISYSGAVTAVVKPYAGGTAVLLYNTGASGRVFFSLAALTGYAHASYSNVWTGHTGTLSGGVSTDLGSGQSLFLVLKSL